VVATRLNDPCLAKCADDEPIFVLRAQDVTAADAVDLWVDHVIQAYDARGIPIPSGLHVKLGEATAQAERMRDWPTRKLPD